MRMWRSERRCEPGAPHPPTIATFGRANRLQGESHAHRTASGVGGGGGDASSADDPASAGTPPRSGGDPPVRAIASNTPRARSGGARKGVPAIAWRRCSASVAARGTSRHRHDRATPAWNASGKPHDANSARISCVSSAPSACVTRRGAVAGEDIERGRFGSRETTTSMRPEDAPAAARCDRRERPD